MSIHLHREMDKLRRAILAEGTLIQDALTMAAEALTQRDAELADRVVQGDREIDEREIEIEELCLKMIALHQPVAQDLRFIVGVLKMNNDLERIGDLVGNIAKRARYLAKREPVAWPGDLEGFVRVVSRMVHGSLDALIAIDADKARQICADDDDADRRKREMVGALRKMLEEMPEKSPIILKMLDVPRHLERIADLSTNIAEDVIYMDSGQIARHHNLDDE